MKTYRGEFLYYRESTDSWITVTCTCSEIYAWHKSFDGFEIVSAAFFSVANNFEEFKRLIDENH